MKKLAVSKRVYTIMKAALFGVFGVSGTIATVVVLSGVRSAFLGLPVNTDKVLALLMCSSIGYALSFALMLLVLFCEDLEARGDISGKDLNYVCDPGEFRGQRCKNAPGTGWGYITVEVSEAVCDDLVLQYWKGFFDDREFVRSHLNGVWSAWSLYWRNEN